MPRRLNHLVRRVGLRLHRNPSRFHGVPHTPSPPKSFDLNLIIPPSVAETIEFDEHALTRFLRSCNWNFVLHRFQREKENESSQPQKALSFANIPGLLAVFCKGTPNGEKTLYVCERESLLGLGAVIRSLKRSAVIAFNEPARVIKVNVKKVAEWDGVFEVDGGQHLYFLNCKHKTTVVSTSVSWLC